jgi:serine/threonine protein kinase
MILAIEALHNLNIVHRDLKPENVLLTIDGHISITDFGLAKEIGASDKLTRTLCGTSEYMAPEMIARSGYGKAVDWWSLGVLFFEMLTGKLPFFVKNGNQKELDKKIMTEKFVAPNFLTGNAQTLLRGMLDKDPNKRLGASKASMFQVGGVALLKRHPFFEGAQYLTQICMNHNIILVILLRLYSYTRPRAYVYVYIDTMYLHLDYDWEAAAALSVPPPFRFDEAASGSAANFHQGE